MPISTTRLGGRRKNWVERDALPSGIDTAEATVGLRDAGHLHGTRLERALASAIGSGSAELVCHPGVGGDELARRYAWRYDWEAETRALCATGLRERLAADGFALARLRRDLPA
jgi:hypothetical protein